MQLRRCSQRSPGTAQPPPAQPPPRGHQPRRVAGRRERAAARSRRELRARDRHEIGARSARDQREIEVGSSENWRSSAIAVAMATRPSMRNAHQISSPTSATRIRFVTTAPIVASSMRCGRLASIAFSYWAISSVVASRQLALTGSSRSRCFEPGVTAAASDESSPAASPWLYIHSAGSLASHNSSNTEQCGSTAGVPHASASSTVRPYVSDVLHVTNASAARYSGGSRSFFTLPVKVTGNACRSANAASSLLAGPSPAITTCSLRPLARSTGDARPAPPPPAPHRPPLQPASLAAARAAAPSLCCSSASSKWWASFSGARRCTIRQIASPAAAPHSRSKSRLSATSCSAESTLKRASATPDGMRIRMQPGALCGTCESRKHRVGAALTEAWRAAGSLQKSQYDRLPSHEMEAAYCSM
mmetsp:Transcript_38665/g.115363  ORF Transcript_38665/g.115363 Transcript_38665/m.115363 type:complete len:418 (+) Transcript_38665:206-1459(+)